MTSPPSIEPLLKTLSMLLKESDAAIGITIDARTGQVRSSGDDLNMSNHQKFTYDAGLEAVLSWINAIPLVSELEMPMRFTMQCIQGGNTPEFGLFVCNFAVTKASSLKYIGASGSIDSFARRMSEIAEETTSTGKPLKWIVESNGHDRATVHARSPHEAVLIFAAIHVRNSYDQEYWRESISKTRGVARMCDPAEWKTAPL